MRSQLAAVRTVQRILDFFTVRFEGDHLLREPLDHLQAAGFEIDRLERLKLGIVERVSARRPPSASESPLGGEQQDSS